VPEHPTPDSASSSPPADTQRPDTNITRLNASSTRPSTR